MWRKHESIKPEGRGCRSQTSLSRTPEPLAHSKPWVFHLPNDDLYQPSWNQHFRIHGWEDNQRVCGDMGLQGYTSQMTVWTIRDGFHGNVNFCMKGTAALVPERGLQKEGSYDQRYDG